MNNKKIFIEIPTWLGDAVMTTPAIENIVEQYPNCELIIFGSSVSTTLFKYHPNLKEIIIDDSKKDGNRYVNLRRLAKSVGNVDMAFSFRRNFTTKFLLWFISSPLKFKYQRYTKKQRHQVLRYNDFINRSLDIKTQANGLKICIPTQENRNESQNELLATKSQTINPKLGINPGATYGSAKRWYPEEFAKVAIELSSQYDIIIFGGPAEIEMAKDIEDLLLKEGITNYQNLAGKTTVEELIINISSLNLFITNDSGPMHLAAAFKIPTIAIFGPTKYKETHQWQNPNEMIVRKDFDCMPCMKRICPLEGEKNHQCMKTITSNDVLNKISANITDENRKKKDLQKEFKLKYKLEDDTKLILFKANNFKQNGIEPYLNIISDIGGANFQAIICGDDESLNYAKSMASKLELTNIIFINDISIKTADIFILPTSNKKFAKNIYKAMKFKCIVFASRQNEATQKLLDVFATMDSPTESNTAHKIDALLNNEDFAKKVQKENKKIATEFFSTL